MKNEKNNSLLSKVVDFLYNYLHAKRDTLLLISVLFTSYPFVLMIFSIKFNFSESVNKDIDCLNIFFGIGIFLIVLYASVFSEKYYIKNQLKMTFYIFSTGSFLFSLLFFEDLDKIAKYILVFLGLLSFLHFISLSLKIILNFMRKLEPKDQLIIILPITAAIISFIFKVNFSFK